jgi:hypothetical protein
VVAEGGGVIGGGGCPGPAPAPMPELGGACCCVGAGAVDPLDGVDAGVVGGVVVAVPAGAPAGTCAGDVVVGAVVAGDDWAGALDGVCFDEDCF